MADVIQLLPDAIANQIAAGEVIQRPASLVKELMENAIDAGSTQVKLISFERHATSKIKKTADLFAIHTMGFRGEALASIAAVAHVELKTRQQKEELGTRIVMEGSAIKTQEPCQCTAGTSMSQVFKIQYGRNAAHYRRISTHSNCLSRYFLFSTS